MKKKLAMLIFAALLTVCASASAQDYYTLPEVRKQAAQGWHETYTDAFGRTTTVDIDVDVYDYGEDQAPILLLSIPDYGETRFELNYPYDTVAGVKRFGGQRTHVYRTYGEPVDLDKMYGAEYGNDLTVREMYDYLSEILEQQGIPSHDYNYDSPKLFDVLCNVKQATGEVAASAFYLADLWTALHGMPILTHSINTFEKQSWPIYYPRIQFQMRNKKEYSIYINSLEEKELIVEDIPLCSFEQVTQNLESEIESGHIQMVLSLRFGFALYNDPSLSTDPKLRTNNVDYYAVPSWVIECIYVDNPKQTFTYSYEEAIKDDPDADVRSTAEYKVITINAQTGKMLNPYDTSKNGWGDADYKGFIPWDDVK